jgi:hypothetical protein
MIALATTLAADPAEVIPILGTAGSLIIALTAIILSYAKGMHRENVRGRTQREIAAYVAEGTMTPEEGERLIRASVEPKEHCS